MRVFLTGGAGFVGGSLLQSLIREGHEVVGLAHRQMSPVKGVQWAPGTIMDVDALQHGMKDCHAVIHLDGAIPGRAHEALQRTHIQGTAHLVEAMRRAGISRLLHMSALGAGAKQTAFFRSKWEAEELVRASGFNYTIFRPSLIFGPGDSFISHLANQLRYSPIIPVIGNGEYRVAPISIHVVTTALLRALMMNGDTLAKTFELCGPEVLTYTAVLDILAERLQIHKPRVHIPEWLITTFAQVMRFLHIPSVITPDQLRMLGGGDTCANDSAYAVLRLPRITLAEGVAEYL